MASLVSLTSSFWAALALCTCALTLCTCFTFCGFETASWPSLFRTPCLCRSCDPSQFRDVLVDILKLKALCEKTVFHFQVQSWYKIAFQVLWAFSWKRFHVPFRVLVIGREVCSMHLFQISVPCICSRLPFHASVPDFRSMHLLQTSIPCICSRLPFHASAPDFHSMHLLQTSVPCICSRLPFHASAPDFSSMHLLQTSIPCICSRLQFHSIVKSSNYFRLYVTSRWSTAHQYATHIIKIKYIRPKWNICVVPVGCQKKIRVGTCR